MVRAQLDDVLSDEFAFVRNIVDTGREVLTALDCIERCLLLYELISAPEEATARGYLKSWIRGAAFDLDQHLRYLRTGLEAHHYDEYGGLAHWAADLFHAITRCRTTVGTLQDHFL